jgi:glycosyltransferase involved in cell wall biosynthesis
MKADLQLMDMMRRSLGMVIPVWFPASLTADQVRESLLVTLDDCEHFLPWDHVVLVVDGDVRSYPIVQALQESCRQQHGQTFDVIYSPDNRGKGYAVVRGAQWFLEKQYLEYLTIRDADGDHALNDLVNLMRLALALRVSEGTDALIIVGRRNHPHRALGWIRGELETLLNRVLVDAARFALAQRQQVLNTRYFSLSGEYPDLHSGYKVYSRRVCELMVQAVWERPPWVGPEIYRYGVEAVPFIEGVMSGAIVGEITRLSRESEFSGHGGFAQAEANGSVLLWTFLRLGMGASQAGAILDNHLARLTLWSDQQGRQTLLMLRQFMVENQLRTATERQIVPDIKLGLYF